jgi:hypothetical protein
VLMNVQRVSTFSRLPASELSVNLSSGTEPLTLIQVLLPVHASLPTTWVTSPSLAELGSAEHAADAMPNARRKGRARRHGVDDLSVLPI